MEVVVIVAAGVAHPEDLVDIVAVNVPGLLVVAGIGFHKGLPLFAVVVAPAVGGGIGVNLLDERAQGVLFNARSF